MQKHFAKKRFGQNFLKSDVVIDNIISSLNLHADDCVVEIGPGQGALTKALLSEVENLTAIELDRDLVAKLRADQSLAKLKLIQADALDVDFSDLQQKLQQKIRVVGNLPYNISTPLIFHLLAQIDGIQDMHFMLQKEVVARIAANPGSKVYGRLSLMVQYFCQAEELFAVPPHAFDPEPKVDSAVIRLVPHQEILHPVNDLYLFKQVVTEAFNQRRKTIANSLKKWLKPEDWQNLAIDPSLRAEVLSLEQFVKISNYIADDSAGESN